MGVVDENASRGYEALMRRIKEYKRLENDWLQSKGKALLLNRSRQGVFSPRPQKDLRMQESEA